MQPHVISKYECVTFCHDSMFAGGVGFACSSSHVQKRLSDTLCVLGTVLHHKCRREHCHIHGHCGLPLHALADALCELVSYSVAPPSVDVSGVIANYKYPLSMDFQSFAWLPAACADPHIWAEYPAGMLEKWRLNIQDVSFDLAIPNDVVGEKFDDAPTSSAVLHDGRPFFSSRLCVVTHNAEIFAFKPAHRSRIGTA